MDRRSRCWTSRSDTGRKRKQRELRRWQPIELEKEFAPEKDFGACTSSWEMAKAVPVLALRERMQTPEVSRVPPGPVNTGRSVVVHPGREASQTRDYCIAKSTALRLRSGCFARLVEVLHRAKNSCSG